MGESTLLREQGIERFAIGGTVGPAAPLNVTDTASNVVQADVNRAYVVIELITEPATGAVFFGVGTTAQADKGRLLVTGAPQKIFTKELISAIVDTATETATVIFQTYAYGKERTGEAV